jgi:hypothetical protein
VFRTDALENRFVIRSFEGAQRIRAQKIHVEPADDIVADFSRSRSRRSRCLPSTTEERIRRNTQREDVSSLLL